MLALTLLLMASAFSLHQIVAVVPPVRLQLAMFQSEDRGDRFVEERQIVRDHQHPAPIGCEPLDEPGLGVEVEMVGRLVEEKDVGLGEEDPRQLDPPPLATGHRQHRLVELVVADPQRSGHSLSLGLCDETTLGLEFLVETAEVGDTAVPLRPVEVVEPATGLLDSPLKGTDLTCHQDSLQSGGVGVLQLWQRGLLGEIANAARAEHRPFDRSLGTGEGPDESGLARTVSSDEADPVSGLHAERGPFEQDTGTDIDSEVAGDQHGRNLCRQNDRRRLPAIRGELAALRASTGVLAD